MQKVKVMCLVVIALLAVSCATLHRSMSVDVGIGVGTGAVASVAAAGGKGALKGALFGAAIGAASSYLIHGVARRGGRPCSTSISTPTSRRSMQDFRLSTPDVDKECFDWEV